ncbi:MAG: DNA mismatch repair endonuclease MutL [Clostridia bacterium]|nr:DNA mismatch repair endonuclease MutL [Clostridia bacterium]
MGNIVLLDDLTINQIAAGEVIERPANVVKELVENSLDAGATNIVVEIKKGGKTYIRVTDNGKGIAKDDLQLAFERHATSKIRQIEDLEKTYTMGFRGEALASIASISELTIISKTEKDTFGNKIKIKAGDIVDFEEVGASIGTSMIVENLFFNQPVRYKFLKQDASEFKVIKEWMQKVALANPDKSFKLINESKVVFFVSGNGNIEDIIYQIYGKEIKDNLVNVDYSEGDIKITGVIGNTMIAKENRKSQIIFLNKRNIKNPVLSASSDQAFKGSVGIGKYGFYVLNIEMPPSYYDVNVHPTKMEVRFKDEDKVYSIWYNAIKSSLLNSEFLGNNEKENNNKDYIKNEYDFVTSKYKDVKKLSKSIDISEEKELRKRDNTRKVEYKYLGILFRTYILIEIDNEIYMIDQHAGHERVLYEQIKENYKKHIQSNSQMMLIPEVVNLSHKEMEFVKENINLFIDTGFDIEVFGQNSVKINGIPDLEYRSKTNNIFLDILDEMITNERTSIKDIEERFIATVACKAAVKANMDLGKEEVDQLIQNLLTLNNPYTCPHGRPTTVKFDRAFFEGKI